MKLTMYQADAFAKKIFSGNPAAVVPLEKWISDELMQQIAMENNQSETAFFVKKQAGANQESDYHLRWFTPEYEIDLCGHATLASAFIIKNFIQQDIEKISFSTEKAGELHVTVSGDTYTLDFPARFPQACAIPEKLFQGLGIDKAELVMKGRDYFVVLQDEISVRKVQPNFSILKELDALGVIITAKGQTADVVSRCFYPGLGIPEDPVTGSAHCNIVPYWAGKLGKKQLFCKQLSLRGGELQCAVQGDRVLMTGHCVLYMKGEIDVG